MNGKQLQEECPVCGEGELIQSSHDTYCDTCYAVRRSQDQRVVEYDDPWEEFQDNRPEYPNSGIKKCVGGFLQPYDWGYNDDNRFEY